MPIGYGSTSKTASPANVAKSASQHKTSQVNQLVRARSAANPAIANNRGIVPLNTAANTGQRWANSHAYTKGHR